MSPSSLPPEAAHTVCDAPGPYLLPVSLSPLLRKPFTSEPVVTISAVHTHFVLLDLQLQNEAAFLTVPAPSTAPSSENALSEILQFQPPSWFANSP